MRGLNTREAISGGNLVRSWIFEETKDIHKPRQNRKVNVSMSLVRITARERSLPVIEVIRSRDKTHRGPCVMGSSRQHVTVADQGSKDRSSGVVV